MTEREKHVPRKFVQCGSVHPDYGRCTFGKGHRVRYHSRWPHQWTDPEARAKLGPIGHLCLVEDGTFGPEFSWAHLETGEHIFIFRSAPGGFWNVNKRELAEGESKPKHTGLAACASLQEAIDVALAIVHTWPTGE